MIKYIYKNPYNKVNYDNPGGSGAKLWRIKSKRLFVIGLLVLPLFAGLMEGWIY